MEKKTGDNTAILKEVVYRLNDILQNQLSIESQSETIEKFEGRLETINENIKKQNEAINTLKNALIPFIVILCFLVALILFYVRKGL